MLPIFCNFAIIKVNQVGYSTSTMADNYLERRWLEYTEQQAKRERKHRAALHKQLTDILARRQRERTLRQEQLSPGGDNSGETCQQN